LDPNEVLNRPWYSRYARSTARSKLLLYFEVNRPSGRSTGTIELYVCGRSAGRSTDWHHLALCCWSTDGRSTVFFCWLGAVDQVVDRSLPLSYNWSLIFRLISYIRGTVSFWYAINLLLVLPKPVPWPSPSMAWKKPSLMGS